MSDKPKIIKVTCAIIEDSGKILAARRSEDMSQSLKWEFPGGKIEPGEKSEDCIVRELKEELDIDVDVKHQLSSHVHDYGNRVIELIPFVCVIKGGDLKCKEHKEILWDVPRNLAGLDWADADKPVYREYVEYVEGDLE
jgi:8-oxo-dGTP diphosphatase